MTELLIDAVAAATSPSVGPMLPSVQNRQFLAALFPAELVDQVHVCSFGADPGQSASRWMGRRLGGDDLPAENNNYFCIAQLKDGLPRSLSNVAAHHVIVADDVGSKVHAADVRAYFPEPTAIIETSPGNESWYWRIQGGPILATDLEGCALVNAVRDFMKRNSLADPGTVDAVRYMRLPVGINTKDKYRRGDGSFPSGRLVMLDDQNEVDLEELAERMYGPDWHELVTTGHYMRQAQLDVSGGSMEFSADHEDKWVKLAEAAGLMPRRGSKPGVIECICPFSDEHTVRGDTGFAILGQGLMRCHHSACIDRNSRDHQDRMCEIYEQRQDLFAGEDHKTARGFLAALAFAGAPDVTEELERLTAAMAEPPEWARQLNEKFCLVAGVSGVVEMNPPGLSGEAVRFWSLSQFKAHHDGLDRITLPGHRAPLGLGSAWLASPWPRRFEQMALWPVGAEPKDGLNLFRGLPRAGRPDEPWPRVLAFINDVIADGREAVAEYVLKWIAWKIQNPLEKPGTNLVLIGDQGTGKSTLGNLVIDLFGRVYSITLAHRSHVTGNFNGHLEGKLLAVANEGTFGLDPRTRGVYKALTTERAWVYEHKGQKARDGINHLALIVTSNEASAVPLEANGRRDTVIRVSNVRRQDNAYFQELMLAWRNGEREAFLGYLEALDLAGFDPGQALATEDRADAAAEAGGDPVLTWWQEILEHGHLPGLDPSAPAAEWSAGEVKVVLRELTGNFSVWARINHISYPPNHNAVLKKLRQLCPGLGESVSIYQADSRKSVRMATVPALADCVAAARRAFGGS
jgi:hypothetical protein